MLVGLGALIVTIVAISAAIGRVSSSSRNVAATSTAPAAAASSASSTLAEATPGSTASIDAWCSGSGYSDYQAVQSDLTQLSTDLGNGDYGTAENADATKLTSDAETAMKDVPPVSRSQKVDYILYLGTFSFAGIDLNSGNVAAADKAINAAASYKQAVLGIVGACG